LISEQLILDEAQKRGVTVSDEEIQAKFKEVEASLNGTMSLDESLKLQGVTRGEYEKSLSINLMVEKMFSDSSSVSAEEIDTFIEEQAGQMMATEPAQQRIEAEAQIKNNRLGEVFLDWFNTAKAEASVSKYLNPN
jgi:DNA primase